MHYMLYSPSLTVKSTIEIMFKDCCLLKCECIIRIPLYVSVSCEKKGLGQVVVGVTPCFCFSQRTKGPKDHTLFLSYERRRVVLSIPYARFLFRAEDHRRGRVTEAGLVLPVRWRGKKHLVAPLHPLARVIRKVNNSYRFLRLAFSRIDPFGFEDRKEFSPLRLPPPTNRVSIVYLPSS